MKAKTKKRATKSVQTKKQECGNTASPDFTIDAAEFHAAIKAAAAFPEIGGMRPHLNGIHMEIGKDAQYIVATNGVKLYARILKTAKVSKEGVLTYCTEKWNKEMSSDVWGKEGTKDYPIDAKAKKLLSAIGASGRIRVTAGPALAIDGEALETLLVVNDKTRAFPGWKALVQFDKSGKAFKKRKFGDGEHNDVLINRNEVKAIHARMKKHRWIDEERDRQIKPTFIAVGIAAANKGDEFTASVVATGKRYRLDWQANSIVDGDTGQNRNDGGLNLYIDSQLFLDAMNALPANSYGISQWAMRDGSTAIYYTGQNCETEASIVMPCRF